MSGNPFRRAQQPPPLVLPVPETRFPPLEDLSPPETKRRSTKTKRVRIETPPPLSPDPETPLASIASETEAEPIHQVAHESHTGSPPPALQSDGVSEYNPFDRRFNELAQMESSEVLENTRRNSGSGEANPALPSPELIRGVPDNPFARTLATMEPGRTDTQAAEDKTGKKDGTMGVDDFAKMLLTGKGPPAPPLQQVSTPEPPGAAIPSSVSQQRGSREEADDSSSSSAEDSSDSEDENEVRATPASRNTPSAAVKQKPAPPKHRHGKSVAERTPQTVSFADFDEMPASSSAGGAGAAPTESDSTASKGDAGASANPRPSGKALPQLPPTTRKGTATESSSKATPLSTAQRPPSVTTASEDALESPKSPAGSRGDFTSTTSTPPPLSASKTAKAPPPPPARRAGNRSSVYDPNTTPLGTPDVSSTPSYSEDYVGRPRKAMAEVFQPQGQASSSRSSSRSGRINMPPPPPPRRRGSSKGSMDSHHQADMTGATSAQATAPAGDQKQRADVLANLDALQAEVDALRVQYGQSN